MDLEQVFDFTILMQERSTVKAAAKLGISPATLSARMLSLEKDLGAELFDHTHHHFCPTKDALSFYQSAVELCQQASTIREHLNHLQGEVPLLSLSIAGNGMPPNVEPVLVRLGNRFPTLCLNVQDESSDDAPPESLLLKGRYDLCFRYLTTPVHQRNVQCRYYFSTRLCVLLPSNHRLSHAGVLSFRDLDYETFVLYPKYRQTGLYELEKNVLEKSHIHFRLIPAADKAFFLSPVAAGLALSIVPEVLRDHVPMGVVSVPLRDADRLSMYFLYSSLNFSPLLHTFIRDLQRTEKAGMQ